MKRHIPVFGIALSFLFSAVPGSLLAFESSIALESVVVLDVLSKAGAESDIRYRGQAAKQGMIDLTATNGFFDRCFEALDSQPVIPGDEEFINVSYGSLGRLSDEVRGTARWHLWCAAAGEIKATFFMQVPAGEANHPWVINVGDETQTLNVHPSDGSAPQQRTLTFTVKQPGKITFAIDCTKNTPPAETRIRFIRLEGSAVNNASMLRTRWRPAAVHGHYFAPAKRPAPKMWVFETRPVAKTSSYSPLTTPFGYFGTSFKDDGRIPPGNGFNFSMWIAGRNATEAPPIEKMTRLIGTDLPDARYGTFGSEGTGVRFAGVAYKDGADRTIQALRIDFAEDGLRIYYGYFYDEPEKRWKLWASAQAPGLKKTAKSGPDFGTLRGTGSFCEIPGPPNRERSGDVVREIKRRGWFYGRDQTWYRAQLSDDSDSGNRKKAKPSSSDRLDGKRVYYMEDYATDGWMSMATGGMENYIATAHDRQPPQLDGAPAPLPEYLSPEKTAQLFERPVEFGKSNTSQISANRATIDYEITKTWPNSKAVLYYGPVDCLTYPPQKVGQGSAVQIDMSRPERTWQSATYEQNVQTGTTRFKLSGLQASTTYYYRLFVAHDQGKSWDYESGSFQTK